MKATWLLRMRGGGGAIGSRSLLLLQRQLNRKRSGISTVKLPTAASRQIKRTSPRRTRVSAAALRGGTHPASTDPAPLSLADFQPAIARTWIAAASNKMLQPQHVAPDCRKLAWWICPSCQHQYNKRIDLHLAAGGACPKCHVKPSLTPSPPAPKQQQQRRRGGGQAATATRDGTTARTVRGGAEAAIAVIAHRCRPNSSQDSLTADNANMLSKSVADDQYLRVQETRNLLPMLAKNFDKERRKISEDEVIYVSPKLDGIRCVVAFRADTKQVLFFSRSGTLFECCDDCIEPAVRRLFEKDPTLVLDGELYNDSVNLAQLAALQRKGAAKVASSSSSSSPAANPTSSFYAQLLATANATDDARAGSSAQTKGKKSGKATASAPASAVIGFEQLTSAIRTTRQHLTPAVAALQRQLQYHVFDVLYARDFPGGSAAAIPFSVRYAFLEHLLASATRHNIANMPGYNPLVLRRVTNVACRASEVDEVLRAAMRVGYEGVMVRRDSCEKYTSTNSSSAVQPAKKKVKQAASSAGAGGGGGGYGYGKRSSTLLKYKVMQDAEYVIVGAVEGSGKWQGSLGAFICVTPKTQQRFTVTPASTDAEKKRMWRTWRQAYQGKALTVQYQELTPDGVPRFPVGKSVRGAADGHDWV